MKRVRATLFPIFDWGSTAIVIFLILFLGVIAIFIDPLLALYMGLGAYAGMVLRTSLQGLAPDEIDIHEREVAPISTMLNSGSLIEQIGDRVWAPSQYKSWWWESARISIMEDEPGKFRLQARQRDLKIIVAKLRRQGLR